MFYKTLVPKSHTNYFLKNQQLLYTGAIYKISNIGYSKYLSPKLHLGVVISPTCGAFFDTKYAQHVSQNTDVFTDLVSAFFHKQHTGDLMCHQKTK